MRYFLTLYLLTFSLVTYAIVAHPSPATITQPDGSTLEITLHGDEYLSVTTTIDGYSLIRDTDGYMKYATIANDTFVSSGIIANNPQKRTIQEIKFLSGTQHYLIPNQQADDARDRRRHTYMAPSRQSAQPYDYTNFRGLVILVEFNDCKFSRSDIADIFTDMITKPGYDGFTSANGEKIKYTGSVRDYFQSNTMGRFKPDFDIVGPVTIDYSQTFPCASENNHIIIPAALNAADPLVDYSLYDTDGDNVVEMVYFIFAGAGANYAGNDSHYLWPHAAQVGSSMSLDGVKFKRYACSTEFYGQEKDRIIDGIGTICHEFSHVLGLPDLYDTDYSSTGLSVSPEDWSIMAGGSYLNYARTPCCYSLYERYALGMAYPEKINEASSHTLQTIGQSNTGFRIDSSIPNEYFLIENRQNTGWDKHLPGHGMIVFRVDSTSVEAWVKNKVNADAKHNYYELLRANPTYNDKGKIIDSQGDAFPGSGNISQLTNTTTPSLRSWTGMETAFIITDIAESADGEISFHTKNDAPEILLEDFENCPATDIDPSVIQGKFCSWTLADGARIESIDGLNNGSKSVAMTMGTSLTSAPITKEIDFISVDFHNPTNYLTTIICQYSTDNGKIWQTLNTIDNNDQIRLGAKTNSTVIFTARTPAGCSFRFTETIGNRTSYIDNICFMLNKNAVSESTPVTIGSPDNMHVVLNGCTLSAITDSKGPITLYTTDGRIVATCLPSSRQAVFTLPARGLYILRQNSNVLKILY